MWKPSVNAICSRAASRLDADAASGSGSSGSMRLRLSPRGSGSGGSARWWSCRGAASARAGLELGDDRHRQHLAQLDPPLVEGVDPPDRPLGEDAVLVEGDQRAERRRVSRSARIVFEGRLPSITRCGTTSSAVPSARTCSAVLPKASASPWAKTLDISRSWWSPSGFSEWAKPMKSQGISRVPWWISW